MDFINNITKTGSPNKPERTETKVSNPVYGMKKPRSFDSLTGRETEDLKAVTKSLHHSSEVKIQKTATLRGKKVKKKPRSKTAAEVHNPVFRVDGLDLTVIGTKKGVKWDDQKAPTLRSRGINKSLLPPQNARIVSDLRLFEKKGSWFLSFKPGEWQENQIDLKGSLSKDNFDCLVSASSEDLKQCAQCLYAILPKEHKLAFIKNLIEAEFRKIRNKQDSSETQGSLLRESSLTQYMMVHHIEILSFMAINHILGPLFKKLYSITKEISPQVDSKLTTVRNFQLLCLINGVLERACKATADYTHRSVKKMFKELAVLCKDKFPDCPNLSDQQIGGIYFLRILNLTIALSYNERTFTDDNHKQRYSKTATLISRILQSTVSEATAGLSDKENLNKIPENLMFAFSGEGFKNRKKMVLRIIHNLKTLDE
jgi:hypothetical protein